MARVEREGDADRMWANAPGGYVLKPSDAQGNVTLSASMLPIAGKQQQNGFLIVSGGPPRGQMMRCGVEFARNRLVIMGPRWNKVVASEKLAWDGRSKVDLKVYANFDQHEVVVEANGKRISAPMPKGWARMRHWGYGASNAETVFGKVEMQ